MNTKIEYISTHRVATIRRVGCYGEENGETMERLKRWAHVNDLMDDEAIILGIAHDDPSIVLPKDCRYDTCLVIEDFAITGDVQEGRVVGGRYFVATIDHTAEAMKEAWMHIHEEVTNQGYQMDMSRPIMERYTAMKVKAHQCELCIPIVGDD